MLNHLESKVLKILAGQKAIQKEEIIIKINLEKKSKNEAILGYGAFKLVVKTLENKSLISRFTNNSCQITTLGKRELEKSELSLATS